MCGKLPGGPATGMLLARAHWSSISPGPIDLLTPVWDFTQVVSITSTAPDPQHKCMCREGSLFSTAPSALTKS